MVTCLASGRGGTKRGETTKKIAANVGQKAAISSPLLRCWLCTVHSVCTERACRTRVCTCTLQIRCWHCFRLSAIVSFVCNFSWLSVYPASPRFQESPSAQRYSGSSQRRANVVHAWIYVVHTSAEFFVRMSFYYYVASYRLCSFVRSLVRSGVRPSASSEDVGVDVRCASDDMMFERLRTIATVRNYCFFLIYVATLVLVRSSSIFFISSVFASKAIAVADVVDEKKWKRANNGRNCMKCWQYRRRAHTRPFVRSHECIYVVSSMGFI